MPTDSRFVVIFSGSEKKDLLKRFDELTHEFWDKKVSGSITLHYSLGYLAKIQQTQFD